MLPGIFPVVAFAHFMGLWQSWKFYGNKSIWENVKNLLHFVSFLAVVASAISFVTSLTATYQKMTLTITISWISDYVTIVAVPVLVAITARRGSDFRALVKRLSDLNIPRNKTKLKKLDICCRIAICYTLTIGAVYCYAAIGFSGDVYKEPSTITLEFFLVSIMSGYFILIYPIIIQIVFAALCLLMAQEFRAVADDMTKLLQAKNQENWKLRVLRIELAWLRCYHQELCDLTTQLGRLFSPLLVVVIPVNLVSLIVNMFYFSAISHYLQYIWLAVRAVDCVFHLLLTSYAADCLSNQAKEMENVIQRYPVLNFNLHEQLQLLLLAQKTWKSCSALDIMGFFVISRDLVPAILGSFLTYVILLYQEYSTNH